MKKYFIQKAIKHPGRVRRYLKSKYGDKAFLKNGNIRVSYLNKAIKETKDKSLKRALQFAKTLKRF